MSFLAVHASETSIGSRYHQCHAKGGKVEIVQAQEKLLKRVNSSEELEMW